MIKKQITYMSNSIKTIIGITCNKLMQTRNHPNKATKSQLIHTLKNIIHKQKKLSTQLQKTLIKHKYYHTSICKESKVIS